MMLYQNPYLTNSYMQKAIVQPAMQQIQAPVMQQQAGAWIDAVSASLGRPACVRGTCLGGEHGDT